MKKLTITATLLSGALALTVVSCGNKSKEAAEAPASSSKVTKTEKNVPASLNIRYIDADSITANYVLAQEFQELSLSTMSKISSTEQARGAEIQRLAASIDQKGRNNGYLSQESYEADMASLAKKQQDAQNVLGSMQRRAQQEMAQRQIELNDSLESFIKDYNKEKGYDAILFKAAGVYFNPALDITDEVIKGLNERYEKGKKSK